ncbi:MAG: LemA family protein [Sporichthyaceae bacterium]
MANILIIAGLALGLLLLGVVLLYNRLVRLRNGVEGAAAGIEVELNRRWDLIPNLVTTVKGYAAHESATLEAVTAARQAGKAAQGVEASVAAEDGIAGALGKVFALAESYPELKADENFRQLQADLEETENRVAFSRQYYNESVRRYADARQTFPGNLIAARGKFSYKEYHFPDDPAARGPASVDLS